MIALPSPITSAVPDRTARPALDVSRLSVTYPGVAEPALTDLSLRVAAGGGLAVVGPNGSGKSTLLKAITGLVPVQSGQIRLWGQPFRSVRTRVAYLSQQAEIDWGFPISVQRLVLSGRYARLGWFRRPGRPDDRRVAEALDRVGLGDLAGRPIAALSGGQRRRMLIARALAQEAELLLLDEPWAALDTATRDGLIALLTELRRDGLTLILTTHDRSGLVNLAGETVALQAGRRVEPSSGRAR